MTATRLLVVVCFGLLACARHGAKADYPLSPSAKAPSAMGEIAVKTTDDFNQQTKVRVEHLPQPAQLDPSLQNFVVWLQPEGTMGQEPINVGQLIIDEKREGELSFVTPHRTFTVMVTAETTPTPMRPSEYVVLEGHVPEQVTR